MEVLVVRHVDADDLAPEMACEHDQAARDDAVMEDLLVVVDVVDEPVESGDALAQAGLDDGPLLGRDDAGDRIEGKDALGARRVAGVDRERHAAVEERAVRELGGAAYRAPLHRRDLGDELGVVGRGIASPSAPRVNISS